MKYHGAHQRRLAFLEARRRSVRVLILAIVLAGCGSDPVGCDPCFTEAIVYGSLSGPQGSDVSGRNISVEAYPAECGIALRAGLDMVTDAQGRFRGRMSSPYKPFTAECLSVTVQGENGGEDVIREYPVFLEFRFEADPALLDSVRVDVVL